MPTKKIAEPPKFCGSPDHDPPSHQVFEPGTYEHTCSACGKKTIFTVSAIIASLSGWKTNKHTPSKLCTDPEKMLGYSDQFGGSDF